MLQTIRQGSALDTSDKVAELLNRGVAPQSVWDALFNGAGELLLREPGIRSLHAVTTTNAMHFAFGQTASDESKRLLLLQNAAFIPHFRGAPKQKGTAIDQLEPAITFARQNASLAGCWTKSQHFLVEHAEGDGKEMR